MDIKINIIAAVADNLAIGNKGQLLWHISEDLKYFKKVTMGCPVIMGRKTFESLGRPLPGRQNIVLTHNPNIVLPEGVVIVGSINDAIEKAGEVEKVFVIGGAEIYRQAIEIADKMYITQVYETPEGADAFFPQIDAEIWEIEHRSEMHTDPISEIKYEFLIYKRR